MTELPKISEIIFKFSFQSIVKQSTFGNTIIWEIENDRARKRSLSLALACVFRVEDRVKKKTNGIEFDELFGSIHTHSAPLMTMKARFLYHFMRIVFFVCDFRWDDRFLFAFPNAHRESIVIYFFALFNQFDEKQQLRLRRRPNQRLWIHTNLPFLSFSFSHQKLQLFFRLSLLPDDHEMYFL